MTLRHLLSTILLLLVAVQAQAGGLYLQGLQLTIVDSTISCRPSVLKCTWASGGMALNTIAPVRACC